MKFLQFFKRPKPEVIVNTEPATDEVPYVNHLIFHLHCVEHEKTYYALEQIKKHIALFDGYKIFTVSSSIEPYCEAHTFKKLIKTLINIDNTIIIPVDNDLHRRESRHFFTKAAPLLKTLLQTNTNYSNYNNYIFYAHNKGVTHNEKNYAITAWVNTLWKYNIELYHDKVKSLLNCYKFVGCLKSQNQHAIESVCHYQGTFFWFNANLLTDHSNWYHNHQHILSLEMWPGLVASAEDCFSVFDLPEGDLYRKDFWYNQYFIGKIDKPHTVHYYML